MSDTVTFTNDVPHQQAKLASNLRMSYKMMQSNEDDQVEKLYDEWAASYDQGMCGQLRYQGPGVCIGELANVVSLKGCTVLDVGCGTGLVADEMIEQGFEANIIGTDISQGMLDIAAKKERYDRLIKWNSCDCPWPISTASVDACISCGVLVYVQNVDCLDEFIRVTKVGGYVILMHRHDGYAAYEAKDQQLRESGQWELVNKTQDCYKFPQQLEEAPTSQALFNVWTYKVLKH
eukprot:TRINITY_DN4008_c0_g2_i4.p1 TRINITY_DN4008_c0_g2~~TRINITY_DN4008_c0_g2_i4.p1  ORF type:complete len:274 (+),score=14.36 TRINITY_DN4008_c0_g2_i4:121-822(+)